MRSVEVVGAREIRIQADYSVLPMTLGFFALRTVFGLYPQLMIQYAIADQVISGLFGAYLLVQAAAYVRKYYANPVATQQAAQQ